MSTPAPAVRVAAVSVRDPQVLALVEALTVELSLGGYSAGETFGYSTDQLERTGVHLVGASVGDRLVGIAGVELHEGAAGELKRFFVVPEYRGRGVADALVTTVAEHAAARGVEILRLETGDKQQAAMAFYRRHGFEEVPRFGP